MSRRVWLATTVEGLGSWLQAGQVPIAEGHAVTAALRAAWPDGNDEDWEYAVLLAAAEEAAALLLAPGRRVVVVVEAASVTEKDGTSVTLDQPEAWRRVVAVHADPPDARVPPRAAAEDQPDLGWYAVQEVPQLLIDDHG